MKNTALFISLCLLIFSCSKESKPDPVPPTVNNGPIGGTYTYSGSVTNTYDTIPGSGVTTITEYLSTSTNLKGSTTITASSITSKGLMLDYTTTGSQKEINTSTGAQTTTTIAPTTGSRGASNSSYNSNYTINTTTGELTIDDAQYLFNPAFLSQPANKKHTYTLTGTVLKVTSVNYDAASKHKIVNESTFTKQ